MKKKSFAAFLAACITVTTVLSPFESVPAFAAQEKEVSAVAAQTEAAETTENTETSETSDDTETTETSDDTEETENTETTEEPEETERTEATETPDATEETESTEEPEDTESTEEDELVGDVDKVSDIINVDVMTSTRNHYFTDAGKTIQKEYCYSNAAARKYTTFTVPVSPDRLYDADTGFYKYNGRYYASCYTLSSGEWTQLYGEVVKVLKEEPEENAAGFYEVDGNYYTYVGYGKFLDQPKDIYYVTASDQVILLGTVGADEDVKSLYGKKIAEGENEEIKYYEVNGRYFRQIYEKKRGNIKTVYAQYGDEISFTKRNHKLSWNPVSNQTEISDGTNRYYVGYQVRINGQMDAMDMIASDGQSFMEGDTYPSYITSQAFAPGEEATYEIRALYYTAKKTSSVLSDGTASYETTYTIVKTGAWSTPYHYACPEKELKKLPAVTNFRVVTNKNRKAKLMWDASSGASYYRIYRVSSDTPIRDFSNVTWSGQWIDAPTNYATLDLTAKYNYFYVIGGVGYENDSYSRGEGEASNILEVVRDADLSTLTPVTGASIEQDINGNYRVKWDELPQYRQVYVVTSRFPEVFETDDYLIKLANASGSYLYDAESGTTKTVSYQTDDSVSEAYQIAVKKAAYKSCAGNAGVDGVQITVPAGETWYVKVVAVDDSRYDEDRSAYTSYTGSRINKQKKAVEVRYGNYNDVAASATLSVKGELKTPSKPETKSEKTQITLTFTRASGVTGYEIYRRSGKGKYQKIATTTSVRYVDEGLKEGKTYNYKARAYVYDTATKKKSYSNYVMFSAETSTKNYIKVTAAMKSKNSIKVSWLKVPGITKYEVYRCNTFSISTDHSVNKDTSGNYKWKLIKTITKANTVSYTDKKLNAGEDYMYMVVAYYKDGKEQKEIHATSGAVSLKLEAPLNVRAVLKKNKVTISWDKNRYAKKYQVRYTKVDKENKVINDTPIVATVGKNSYSVTGLQDGEYIQSISVRAGDGKKWSAWSSSKTSKKVSLPAVKGVTAKNVTVKEADGTSSKQVQISWKALPGADYYKVYRAMEPALRYQSDSKVYISTNYSATNLIAKERNQDEYSSEVYYTDYLNRSGSVVGTSVIDHAQLSEGVTYYYFVIGYAGNGRVSSYGYAKADVSVTLGVTPKIKSAKAKSGKVTLQIEKAAGAKKYVIYRSKKKNSGYQKIGETKKITYVDKKAKKTTYYYKVVVIGKNALQADYKTAMSSPVKVKVK